MKDMSEMMSPPLSLGSPPEKAVATFPMIRLTDGRIAPARTADSEPTNSRSLSYPLMYVKNFRRPIYSGAGSA